MANLHNKNRSSLVGLLAVLVTAIAMLIASQVHAGGQFRPIVQRGTDRYDRMIDPQFRTVCYRYDEPSVYRSTMSCVRY